MGRESIVTVTWKSFRITAHARFADTIFDSYDDWREFQEQSGGGAVEERKSWFRRSNVMACRDFLRAIAC